MTQLNEGVSKTPSLLKISVKLPKSGPLYYYPYFKVTARRKITMVYKTLFFFFQKYLPNNNCSLKFLNLKV